MRKNPKLDLPELGTVIHATLRPEDLFVAFFQELERLDVDRAAKWLEAEGVAVARTWYEKHQEYATTPDVLEELDECVVELQDMLDEYAPAFCYFGSNEGDGADFGFWISEDQLRDGQQEGDLESRNDLPAEYFYHVNDHGNATLYRVKLETVWEVV